MWLAVITDELYVSETSNFLAVNRGDGTFAFVPYTTEGDTQKGHLTGRLKMLRALAANPGKVFPCEKWYQIVAGVRHPEIDLYGATSASKCTLLNELRHAISKALPNNENAQAAQMRITEVFPIEFADEGYALTGVNGEIAVRCEFDQDGNRIDAADIGAASPGATDANKEDVRQYLKGLSRMEIFTKIRTRSTVPGQRAVEMPIERYQHRRLCDKAGNLVTEASLLRFDGNVRVRYVVAEAGCGKTVLSQVLVQAALSQHALSTLSAKLLEAINALDGEVDNAGLVPFYFSFNPPYGAPGAPLDSSTESLLPSFLGGLVDSYQAPLPHEVEARTSLIASLGNRAVFIVDALDEATDYEKAQIVLLQVMGTFPEAGLVVTSRRLSSWPAFALYNGQAREDCDVVELLPLEAGEEQMEMLQRHLTAWLTPEEAVDADQVSNVLSNHHASALLANPLFATYVAQKCSIDSGSLTVDVHAACMEAVGTLLGKAADVLNRSVRDGARHLEGTELKRTLARVSLALQLDAAGAFDSERDGLFAIPLEGELAFLRKVADLATSREDDAADGFCSAMVIASSNDGAREGFLSHVEACRSAVVASGVVSYDPSCSACSFVNPVIKRYLAAWALVELLARAPKEGRVVLSKLLRRPSCDGAGDVVVMCVSIAHKEREETGASYWSEVIQLAIVNEVLKLELHIPQEPEFPSVLLEEVAERTFGDSHLEGYQTRACLRPYRDMLRAVVGSLRREASDEPARNL